MWHEKSAHLDTLTRSLIRNSSFCSTSLRSWPRTRWRHSQHTRWRFTKFINGRQIFGRTDMQDSRMVLVNRLLQGHTCSAEVCILFQQLFKKCIIIILRWWQRTPMVSDSIKWLASCGWQNFILQSHIKKGSEAQCVMRSEYKSSRSLIITFRMPTAFLPYTSLYETVVKQRDKLLSMVLWIMAPCSLKGAYWCSSKTLVTTYKTRQCHNPKDWQRDYCFQNLLDHIYISTSAVHLEADCLSQVNLLASPS